MILRGENLIKEYGPKKVVKGVSIEVEQGQIVGLLGPNGAGKTTTFYMIVGLVKPTSGNIFLDEQNITTDAMYRRAQKGIGYLAQEASVFRKLTVEENLMGVLQLTKLSKKQQREKCDELIEEFGLGHIRKNRGDLLSGGERRRTEIARALATSPKFILLDEPFAGVDPIAVEDIQRIVAQLKNKNIGILECLLVMFAWFVLVTGFRWIKKHNIKLKQLIDGKALIIINNGKVDVENCKKAGLSAHDVAFKLRANNVYSVKKVKRAVVEQNGQFIIVLEGEENPKFPIITDGHLQKNILEIIGKDEEWLKEKLNEKGYEEYSQIFLGEYVDGKIVLVSYE